MLTSAKLRCLGQKEIFAETRYMCALSTEFQASSIILTSFRQGVILHTHNFLTSKQTTKMPTQIRVKDLSKKTV